MSRRVVIARQDNNGDVLLAGPAIRAIEARAGHVTLLCGRRGRQAAELLPGVDEVIEWRADWIDPEPEPISRRRIVEFVDELAARDFDQAFIFTSSHQSPLPLALVLRLAGIPWIGATSDDYPGSLLDLRHRIDGGLHEVERSLSLVAAAGYELPPGDDGRLRVKHVGPVSGLGEFVAVHPGASVSARAWAPERHRALVDALVAGGRRVVVTGGPGERELTAFVTGAPRPQLRDLGGATDLAGLAAVLAAADAVVVGNTGPAHLAAAVGTPVVSLYAPTVPSARWRPWGVPHVLLAVDVPCAGCRARECPIPGHPCMNGVTVGDVLGALARLTPVGEPAEGVPA